MKQIKRFILLLVLGLVLAPTSAYAVTDVSRAHPNIEVGKTCCDKNEKDDEACSGKCSHKACRCQTCVSAVTPVSQIDADETGFLCSFREKIFSSTSKKLSHGFFSIWVIPKIASFLI